MRNTRYARELETVIAGDPTDHHARLERLWVKDPGQVEIRFSWWNGGQMQIRPLDIEEPALLELLEKGIVGGIFSADFLFKLTRILLTSPVKVASEVPAEVPPQ